MELKAWLRFKQMDEKLLVQAILEYREQGKQLMARLGTYYGLDILKDDDYHKLISRSNDKIPRNGALLKKWNYAFHGMECGFYNRETKQNVEVKLLHPPNFGVVESWFLLSYLKSTEQYKNLAENLDWQILQQILSKLYKDNHINEIKE